MKMVSNLLSGLWSIAVVKCYFPKTQPMVDLEHVIQNQLLMKYQLIYVHILSGEPYHKQATLQSRSNKQVEGLRTGRLSRLVCILFMFVLQVYVVCNTYIRCTQDLRTSVSCSVILSVLVLWDSLSLNLDRLAASKPQQSPVHPCPQQQGQRCAQSLNPRPHDCTANTLTMDPAPPPKSGRILTVLRQNSFLIPPS